MPLKWTQSLEKISTLATKNNSESAAKISEKFVYLMFNAKAVPRQL